jgi:purine-cytosine permease-like protein
VGTVISCAIAIPGYSRFVSVLENFMSVLGYWLAIYKGIALSEHFFFRRSEGYRPWNFERPESLPPSIAALGAFYFGVFSAVMGVAQA